MIVVKEPRTTGRRIVKSKRDSSSKYFIEKCSVHMQSVEGLGMSRPGYQDMVSCHFQYASSRVINNILCSTIVKIWIEFVKIEAIFIGKKRIMNAVVKAIPIHHNYEMTS
jgi:hypothetical protein